MLLQSSSIKIIFYLGSARSDGNLHLRLGNPEDVGSDEACNAANSAGKTRAAAIARIAVPLAYTQPVPNEAWTGDSGSGSSPKGAIFDAIAMSPSGRYWIIRAFCALAISFANARL